MQDGASCLLKACENGHVGVAKYLCERSNELLLTTRTEVSACCVFCACE
jgi:hypothetical protein